MQKDFQYCDEKFADIQMLRYELKGFDKLSLSQKTYVYYLSKAALAGRDITTDQFGIYNLRIRKMLESVYVYYKGNRDCRQFQALVTYLKRLWFSNGIYHHYGCEKFTPDFSAEYLKEVLSDIDEHLLPLDKGETAEHLFQDIVSVMFNLELLPKRVNKTEGQDLVRTSACNYYQGVSQEEVEQFYQQALKEAPHDRIPSLGLNSRLEKQNGKLEEHLWTTEGIYGKAIKEIVKWLEKACEYAENEQQKKEIRILIKYYKTGDLKLFDDYSIEWLKEQDGNIDFVNGFIEVYGDPLGIKGSWEGIVEYKDPEATKRTQMISRRAQWFEDHSPVDPRFRKKEVKGVTAHVVNAAMLGGDEYPSTAIGINLPNADWIRALYGSKSVTIGNLIEAYNKASRGNGFLEEFVIDKDMVSLIREYGDQTDTLHTDLHECLGHGSGQLLPGTSSNALKAYGDTIEEARADIFGLYYIADDKMLELGLLPDGEAYKAQYYTYLMNGLLTQLTRIRPGHEIEEAHMRNRSLIAHWVYAHADGAIELVRVPHPEPRTYLKIHDYALLRSLFADLLAELQRIKSEGDYEAAKTLVETYGIHVDAVLHEEICRRYAALNIAPYKGFINPRMEPVLDNEGKITDVRIDYTERYDKQMLRYSREYGFLI